VNKAEQGFSIIEVIFALIILDLIVSIGGYVLHNHLTVTRSQAVAAKHPNPTSTIGCSMTVNNADDVSVDPVPNLQSINVTDQGALGCKTTLSMTVGLVSKDAAGLEAEANSVSDPTSPNYRHYLTEQQEETLYGPPQASVTTVEQWLQSYNLAPKFDNNASIDISGTVEEYDRAFNTKFDRYKRPNGSEAYANVKALYMPSTLAQDVQGIVGANNLNQIQEL
jgi:subtilase family serine protease